MLPDSDSKKRLPQLSGNKTKIALRLTFPEDAGTVSQSWMGEVVHAPKRRKPAPILTNARLEHEKIQGGRGNHQWIKRQQAFIPTREDRKEEKKKEKKKGISAERGKRSSVERTSQRDQRSLKKTKREVKREMLARANLRRGSKKKRLWLMSGLLLERRSVPFTTWRKQGRVKKAYAAIALQGPR